MPEFKVKDLDVLLSEALGENVEVLAEKSKFLTAPGEHYGSIMLALDVNIKRASGKEEELNLVAKMLPASEILRAAFDSSVTFEKEIAAYTKAIPTLIQFQRKHNVPDYKILDVFPKCYGARVSLTKSEVDEDAVIILENLKVQGYDTGDRFVGFNLDHAKLLVQDLAKFHAVPIALRILHPTEFKEKIGPCMVPNHGIEILPDDVLGAFTDSIIETAKTIPELAELLPKIIKNVQEGIKNKKNKAPVTLTTAYATVVHSDFWVNNTMVLQDAEGKAIKNKIVDLQIMKHGSAIRDLIFFLFTSVINSVLDEHYEDLIKLYHATFIDYLKDFKVDLEPFTWEKFLEEIEDIAPKEFHHVSFMLKPIFTEKDKINNLADFQPSDWGRRDLIGPAHKQKLKDTMLAYAKRGWL